MTVWDDLTGQPDAIAVFRAAVSGLQTAVDFSLDTLLDSTADSLQGSESESESESEPAGGIAAGAAAARSTERVVPATSVRESMTHSWLITGPPGSGRSNLAYAFAAALLCPTGGCGACPACRQVAARTHPDLASVSTERVVITMAEVKNLVNSSQFSPSVGRYRVMVIEDADRMPERTSNRLLKALEEPPPRTVWILCAPSDADLLPTVRSRVRTVRLRVPAIEDVAELLVRRDSIDPIVAERAAREAQSHIGMARRLATNPQARARREETLRIALGLRSVSDAVIGAARMVAIAGDDGKAIMEERDAEERASMLRSLGVEAGKAVPMALRGQIRQLEDDQKRRAKRSLHDGIDRILVDLLSLYRDIIRLQLGVDTAIVNREIEPDLRAAASAVTPASTVATMDAIGLARARIEGNVPPVLALESMLITATGKGDNI